MIDFAHHASRLGSDDHDDLDLVAAQLAAMTPTLLIGLARELRILDDYDLVTRRMPVVATLVDMLESHAATIASQALLEDVEDFAGVALATMDDGTVVEIPLRPTMDDDDAD